MLGEMDRLKMERKTGTHRLGISSELERVQVPGRPREETLARESEWIGRRVWRRQSSEIGL